MKALFTFIIGFSLAFASFGDPAKAADPAEPLFTHVFHLEPATMARLKQLAPPKPGELDVELIVRYLKQQNIDIKKTGTLFWHDRRGDLLIRATLIDMGKISTIIDNIRTPKTADGA